MKTRIEQITIPEYYLIYFIIGITEDNSTLLEDWEKEMLQDLIDSIYKQPNFLHFGGYSDSYFAKSNSISDRGGMVVDLDLVYKV